MNNKKDFLPKGYSLPKSGGNYMKLEKGKNKLRILSAPLLGWIDWIEEEGKKKPNRFAYDKMPETSFNPERPVKHFWAFKVWNYDTKAVQIMEITQSTIQGAIQTLASSEDWGSPIDYDLTIERTGEDMLTKYSVTPTPPKELTEEIKLEVEKVKVDLDKLLEGGDPFVFNETKERVAEDLANAEDIGF